MLEATAASTTTESRISAELDRLNASAAELNVAETALEAARAEFGRAQAAGLMRLAEARAAAGPRCVEAARPAYEARRRCEAAQAEARSAAARYLQAAQAGTGSEAAAAAAEEHARLAVRCAALEAGAARLERCLRPAVARRARAYFDTRDRQRQALAERKLRVDLLEEKQRLCKRVYREAMATLEAISEEVHRARQQLKQAKLPETLANTQTLKVDS